MQFSKPLEPAHILSVKMFLWKEKAFGRWKNHRRMGHFGGAVFSTCLVLGVLTLSEGLPLSDRRVVGVRLINTLKYKL